MATPGVFLGGGTAPKIVQKLKEPLFLNEFTAKGRMKALLQAMPVRVILNDKTALLGAARFAALCAEEWSTPGRWTGLRFAFWPLARS